MLNRRALLLLAALPVGLAGCGDPVVMAEYFTVINVSPTHGAVNVGVDADLRVTFSHPIDHGTIDGAVSLTDASGNEVEAGVDIADDDYTVFVEPVELLDDAATYTLTLKAGLGGQDVGALPVDISTTFTTEGLSAGGNAAPEAIIEPVIEFCEIGAPFELYGGSSFDPEGEPVTYNWRVAGAPAIGDEPILEGADAETALFTALTSGVYVVGLVVSDGVTASSEAFYEFECY